MRRVKGGMEMPINSTIMMAGIIGIFMLIVLVYISLGTNAKIVQANINSLNSIDSTQKASPLVCVCCNAQINETL